MPYPPSNLSTSFDNNTPILNEHPQSHNDTNAAINAIVGELGANPSGTYASIEQRLNAASSNTILTVAANDTPTTQKSKADYICDGVADEVEINTALGALPAAGGKIQLLQGTYNLAATIAMGSLQRVTFEGVGWSTILKPQPSVNIHVISSSSSSCQYLLFRNFAIDGNRTNTISSGQGIRFSGTPSDIVIDNVYIYETFAQAISTNGARFFIRNNIVRNCNAGIILNASSADCWVVNNDVTSIGVLNSLTNDAISNQGTRHRFINNRCQSSDTGINLAGDGHLVIGNTCFLNGNSGINTGGGSNHIIQGNLCYANGRKAADPRSYAGIRIRDHITSNVTTMDSIITGNRCYDDTATYPLASGALGQVYNVEIVQASSHGNPDYNIISDNDLRTPAPGGVSIQGASVGANNQIRDNLGYTDPATASLLTRQLIDYSPATPNDGQVPVWSGAQSEYIPTTLTGASATPQTDIFLVAASNTPAQRRAMAALVCTGTGDDFQIQAAINSLPAGGGRIVLLEGTYNLANAIDFGSRANVTLEGMGPGTVLTQPNATNIHIFSTSSSACTKLRISDLKIDGNQANQTSNGVGIRFSGSPSDVVIENCTITNTLTNAITTNGTRFLIRNNSIINCLGGILLNAGTTDCTVMNNDVTGIGVADTTIKDAISNQGTRNRFLNNRCQASDTGINMSGNSHMAIGNLCFLNGNSGINSGGGSNLVIQGNVCYANGRKSANPRSNAGIRIRDHVSTAFTSANCVVNNNRCYDDTTTYPLNPGAVGQLYGIEIGQFNGNGDPWSNIITNNQVVGNLSDGIHLYSYGPLNWIAGNRGFNPQGTGAVAVGTSPFTYTAGPTPEVLYLSGGTGVSIVTNTSTPGSVANLFASSPSTSTVYLDPGEGVVVTYSTAPTIVRDRK